MSAMFVRVFDPGLERVVCDEYGGIVDVVYGGYRYVLAHGPVYRPLQAGLPPLPSKSEWEALFARS